VTRLDGAAKLDSEAKLDNEGGDAPGGSR